MVIYRDPKSQNLWEWCHPVRSQSHNWGEKDIIGKCHLIYAFAYVVNFAEGLISACEYKQLPPRAARLFSVAVCSLNKSEYRSGFEGMSYYKAINVKSESYFESCSLHLSRRFELVCISKIHFLNFLVTWNSIFIFY